MTKHPKTRDERLAINAKKKEKQQLKARKPADARDEHTDITE
jgi:hypothetical protein